MSALLQLQEHGQSYWLDNLTRGMLVDGELARRVETEGLRGVTSNPAIFHNAITGSAQYDEDIARFTARGLGVEDVYDRLTIADVQGACDVLRGVWESTGGVDGYVSLEVSPHLANDTEGTVREARRLHDEVARENVLIKIPGTPAGVPAIRQALFEGVNVNVTLLFSIAAYEAVADAHSEALEQRIEAGRSVDDVASVASFFVSRIDALTDRKLGALADAAGGDSARCEALLGKAAIANAKLAYVGFQRRLATDRWARLAALGARPQRMLWASTSTKNPAYSDVMYVEPLIGDLTVNTLPEKTIDAFRDHGRAAGTLTGGVDEARRTMAELAAVGIDLDEVTDQLLAEGVEKFAVPFDQLLASLAERMARQPAAAVASGSATP
ncbi:transaldolase [Candidatus Palauibacter soopunensis]|uniref:transaldolase n=1 Tax=Candidatus Palauibacter soopunensis TaxID=3056739 RepID=UPI002397B3E0|nr:transaldolase [Candidatus Palauibacter soopunensis]MDE2879840.1 transaldolase [Candidatus Palauibacter soopunensis]